MMTERQEFWFVCNICVVVLFAAWAVAVDPEAAVSLFNFIRPHFFVLVAALYSAAFVLGLYHRTFPAVACTILGMILAAAS